MDFTFLFVVILMLLAVKNELNMVAVGLFVILLFTAKSKYLLAAAFVGIALAVGVGFFIIGEYSPWVILGALFVVVLLIIKKEGEAPNAGAYGGYAR